MLPTNLEYLINECVKQAQKSTMEHRHGAILVCDGDIVCRSNNFHVTGDEERYSIHAEESIIRKFRRELYPKRSYFLLIVVRLNNSRRDRLMLSKPCRRCTKLLNKCDWISRVVYSTDYLPIK